jgi:outer membrane receptor for ferrienterochelin and colicin
MLLPMILQAQSLRGRILEVREDGDTLAVASAAIQWLHTSVGEFSATDGSFSIPRTRTDTLIVSFPTYESETLRIDKTQNDITIFLAHAHSLAEVRVVARDGSFISTQPILTSVITQQGLRRAACCNLAESFESSVAIDSEFPDAVSGARQIAMLGLAGTYSQILLENVPFIRLLSHQFGLGFIPGSWMESISLSKGTSSVVNGFEAITGQINVDYKKPETNLERFFMNFYANSMGKGELALNTRVPVGKKDKASTNFLIFLGDQLAKMDMNKDGFMDVPRNRQINVMNRWDYKSPVVEGRTMVGFVWDNRFGGQMAFKPNLQNQLSNLPYGFTADNKRVDVITKNGFLLKGEHESIGTIVSYTGHWLNSHYGDKDYQGNQHSVYANVLYSNKFGAKERHKLTAGASLQFDCLNELYDDGQDLFYYTRPHHHDLIPGVFAEYAYVIDPKLVVMAGMRLDYNMVRDKLHSNNWESINQLFWTPRVHLKWQATKDLSVRASAGKGYRNSHFFAENQSLLLSSRNICLDGHAKPEEAWNAGASMVYQFNMPGGKASVAVDYFYTHFLQQMIVDLDKNVHEVHYYALNGDYNGYGNRSRSHSAQIELTLKPFQRFEVLLAYRYNDVRYMRQGVMRQKDLMSPHKALVNLNYSTRFDKWKFNLTLQVHGPQHLPDMSDNPASTLSEYAPTYCIMNAQVTKKFRKWELYVGGENLLNYKQKDPIIDAQNPFSDNFDATVVYAPITGIMGYVGVRVILK